jgi:ketol-acid reductoisomerase
MKEALARIQDGSYAKRFLAEGATGYPVMTEERAKNAAHGIEVVGEKLRGMMPWIAANKIVDKTRN